MDQRIATVEETPGSSAEPTSYQPLEPSYVFVKQLFTWPMAMQVTAVLLHILEGWGVKRGYMERGDVSQLATALQVLAHQAAAMLKVPRTKWEPPVRGRNGFQTAKKLMPRGEFLLSCREELIAEGYAVMDPPHA